MAPQRVDLKPKRRIVDPDEIRREVNSECLVTAPRGRLHGLDQNVDVGDLQGFRIRSIFRSTVRVLRYRAIAVAALVSRCISGRKSAVSNACETLRPHLCEQPVLGSAHPPTAFSFKLGIGEGALWFRANVGRRLSLGGRSLIGA